MATKARTPKVYLVKTPTGNRLVRAFTPAGAIKHAASTFSAAAASQNDLIEALGKGAKVEEAGEGPQDELDV